MTALTRLIPDNPVLVKELRVRMRGARAYWILLGYLGLLSILVLVEYWGFQSHIAEAGAGSSAASDLGLSMFSWIMVPQVFLVLFITPAITSGTITIEKEQQTMDLLSLTRLSRRSIITGKLLSAVSFTALLIVSSLPLISICFMLGGVAPEQVLSTYLEMLTASVLIGALGIMWSSVARTTTQAVLMTYITLFMLFIFGSAAFSASAASIRGGANFGAGEFAFISINLAWFSNTFLGMKVPDGTGFAIFCLLFGMVLTSVATVRIEMFPDRKAYIVRGLSLLLFGVQFLAYDMWWVDAWFKRGSGAIMAATHPPIGAMMLSATLLMLITPIFATGELASFEARRFVKYLLWGWTPAGLRRGKMSSGLPFLMVCCALSLLVFGISMTIAGHARDTTKVGALSLGLPGVPPPPAPTLRAGQGETATLSGSTVQVVRSSGEVETATKLPDGNIQITIMNSSGRTSTKVQAAWPKNVPVIPPPAPPVKVFTPQTGDLMQGALMLFVSVGGFALLCMLFSMAFRLRWVAILAGYLVLLLIIIVPEIANGFAPTVQDTTSSVNVFYLNPIQPFLQMCEPASYWQTRFLWFGHMPMWQAVTCAWAAIGGISLLLMIPFVRRIARENAPVPYEEQVQLA